MTTKAQPKKIKEIEFIAVFADGSTKRLTDKTVKEFIEQEKRKYDLKNTDKEVIYKKTYKG